MERESERERETERDTGGSVRRVLRGEVAVLCLPARKPREEGKRRSRERECEDHLLGLPSWLELVSHSDPSNGTASRWLLLPRQPGYLSRPNRKELWLFGELVIPLGTFLLGCGDNLTLQVSSDYFVLFFGQCVWCQFEDTLHLTFMARLFPSVAVEDITSALEQQQHEGAESFIFTTTSDPKFLLYPSPAPCRTKSVNGLHCVEISEREFNVEQWCIFFHSETAVWQKPFQGILLPLWASPLPSD